MHTNFEINNKGIQILLSKRILTYALEVQCVSTWFRKLYTIHENRVIRLDPQMIHERVELIPCIVVATSIEGFTNEDFAEEYQDMKFDLNAGDIIGIGQKRTFDALYQNDIIKNGSSIVDVGGNDKLKEIQCDFSQSTISLILEKEESQPYPWVCNWHDLENIIEILKYLNKEPEDFIDYIIWRIESHPNVLSSDELNVIEGYFMNSQARKQNGAIFFPANGPSLIDKIYFEKHAIPYEYPVATTVVRKKKKIGRNEPCPCGSGKKFKKCCIEKGIYD